MAPFADGTQGRILLDMFLAACVQLNSTSDIEKNLATAERLVRRAAERGASLVCTPENTAYLGPKFHDPKLAEPLDGPIGSRLSKLADELSIHLLVGGLSEQRVGDDGKVDDKRCHNASVLFGPGGDMVASYRKMHMFDVDVPGGVTVRESATIAPGGEVVVAETPLGRIGMSICYDMRFPELYRALVDAGADIIAVPSAFTMITGKDHWHTLLRARAIETECWVVAPAQWGVHDEQGKRHSYGHSLVVDPWGIVVADKGHGEGICFAEIDPERTKKVRQSIPLRDHRRL